MSNKRRKPTARCFRSIHGLPNKVKKGQLHKKNGPKSRLPAFKPNPKVVAYYEQMSSPFIGLEKWSA